MLTRNDMKMIMNYLYTPACMLLLCAAVVSCSGKEIQRPDVVNPIYPVTEPEGTEGTIAEESLETSISYRGWSGDKSLSRPFASGTEANSVRIPSVVTAADGSLLVFCEARHNSWRDKSYTDIVVRRSTDNGKTWSAVQNLTGSANGGNYAFMDPVPVVAGNGEIFLFCCRWLKDNSDASNNRAFRLSSSDNGVTWSAPEDVTADQRRIAKTANFGIMYGISAFGLAQRLKIPRASAKKIIDDYFLNFPAISSFIADTTEYAREHGYVETLFGRRRYLPDINSKNSTVRSLAERNAVNAPIQGTSADIIKIAMIRVDEEIQARKLKSRMVLQVHDELVFDAVPEEIVALEEIVVEKMQNVIELSVPLTVDCNYGKNWLEAH